MAGELQAASDSRTLVTLATYNELENLPRLVEEILRAAPLVDLLVIDDNSPDGTGRWADQAAQADPRVKVLHREGKQGLGSATIAGMRYAIEQGYDLMLNMDADFSHQPKYIASLLARLNGADGEQQADVVVGSRYVRGGKITGWPLKRYFMSFCVNTYARWMLGLRLHDCSGAFRVYRTSLLKKLDFDSLLSRGYSFQEEILWALKRRGAVLAEVPIEFVDRSQGSSKINLREAVSAVWIILRLAFDRATRNDRAQAF